MPTAITAASLDHKTALVKPAPAACDVTGNTVANGGNLVLEFNNSGASTYTVTVALTSTLDGQSVTPITYSLTAGQTKVAAGWPPSFYGSTLTFTASNAAVTYVAYNV